MNTNYERVIPRDLFNEAKLLKCLGLLCLNIHDRQAPKGLTFKDNGQPFKIALMDEGNLTVTNIEFKFKSTDLQFVSTYNSKSNYPFFCYHDYTEYLVFDENGKFDSEFLEFLKTI